MTLDKLPKLVKRNAKRVGRGIGSGKGGHTTGRGQKGQKARTSIPQVFEGTKIKKSFIKRLPLLRGRGKLKPWGNKSVVVNLGQLAEWPKTMPVTGENLLKKGVLKDYHGEKVKILANGDIKQALEIKVSVSKSAGEKIVKAGGKISA
jgi:large subunit ribosomal protein L15